ncbi:MAG: glycosyltransferase family 2 protein [Actinomycetota bacterium]
MTAPRVSLGLPVFDGEVYLEETLASIEEQTFGDFELIICDNASTDRTEEICRKLAARDPRVRYQRNDRNLGAAPNYNLAFELATGEYFKWVAYDDVLEPRFLETCVTALDEADDDVVLVYPRTVIIDGEGAEVGLYEDRLDLRESSLSKRLVHFASTWRLCNPVFGLIRADVLATTSLIGAYPSSDVTLLGELAIHGRYLELDQPLFHRRIHSRSSRQGELTMEEVEAWFDTSAATRKRRRWLKVSPRTGVFWRLVGSIATADHPVPSRLVAAPAFAGAWWFRRARVRGGELKARLRERGDATVTG